MSVLQRLAAAVAAAAAIHAGASISSTGSPNTGTFTVNWTTNYVLAMDSGSGDWQYAPPGASSWTFTDMPSGTYKFQLYSCIFVPGGPGPTGDHWNCTWSEFKHTVSVTRDAEPAITTTDEAGTSPYSAEAFDDGSARIDVPLRTIPGVNGLALPLALRYDSTRHSAIADIHTMDDALGYGWRLAGIPRLHRCRGGVGGRLALRGADRLCLDGVPLVATAGDYWAEGTEYRTEIQSHIKFKQKASSTVIWFEAHWPDGRVGTFGKTASQVRASGKRTADSATYPQSPWSFTVNPVYQWGLDRLEHLGNVLTVAYEIDDAHGAMNPKTVSYDDAEVRFKYGPRGDLASNAAGSGRVRRNSVLHTVEVRFDGTAVREYRLDSNTVGGRTRLEKVQECGYTESGVLDACLPPLAFEWTAVTGAPGGFGIGVSKVTDGRGADTVFRYRAVSGDRHALNYLEAPFGALIAGSNAEAVEQAVVAELRRDDGRGRTRSFHYRYKGAPQRSTLGRGTWVSPRRASTTPRPRPTPTARRAWTGRSAGRRRRCWSWTTHTVATTGPTEGRRTPMPRSPCTAAR